MKRHGILLVCVWLVLLGLQANGVYNVHDYGANGDGMSLDHVTIRDITIYRGGHFAIIATGCDIGTIDNVTIDTNRDGIDIDCCR